MLKDSNPLFNNFDPENSLFNLTKSHNKAVQNVRVFVNDQGEQVKDEVLYENIVSYSQKFHWVFLVVGLFADGQQKLVRRESPGAFRAVYELTADLLRKSILSVEELDRARGNVLTQIASKRDR